MKFTAHYISKTLNPYHRTVWADTLNEAIKQAEQYTRKHYVMVGVKIC